MERKIHNDTIAMLINSRPFIDGNSEWKRFRIGMANIFLLEDPTFNVKEFLAETGAGIKPVSIERDFFENDTDYWMEKALLHCMATMEILQAYMAVGNRFSMEKKIKRMEEKGLFDKEGKFIGLQPEAKAEED